MSILLPLQVLQDRDSSRFFQLSCRGGIDALHIFLRRQRKLSSFITFTERLLMRSTPLHAATVYSGDAYLRHFGSAEAGRAIQPRAGGSLFLRRRGGKKQFEHDHLYTPKPERKGGKPRSRGHAHAFWGSEVLGFTRRFGIQLMTLKWLH